MHFKEFDKLMRQYEEDHDYILPPQHWLVARLDGRGFSKLTKKLGISKPFDVKYKDDMIGLCISIMQDSGFNILYAYTQSDEISLLFHPSEDSYNRKMRKLNSILAGFTSAKFTQILNKMSFYPHTNPYMDALATFDCRISALPDIDKVVDYFRWRQSDSERNCLQACAYWTLRQNGFSSRKATSALNKTSQQDKRNILIEYGLNYDNRPGWQKRGVGLQWTEYTKDIDVVRRKVIFNEDLLSGIMYGRFIEDLCFSVAKAHHE